MGHTFTGVAGVLAAADATFRGDIHTGCELRRVARIELMAEVLRKNPGMMAQDAERYSMCLLNAAECVAAARLWRGKAERARKAETRRNALLNARVALAVAHMHRKTATKLAPSPYFRMANA